MQQYRRQHHAINAGRSIFFFKMTHRKRDFHAEFQKNRFLIRSSSSYLIKLKSCT
jgi:hypothetical protein